MPPFTSGYHTRNSVHVSDIGSGFERLQVGWRRGGRKLQPKVIIVDATGLTSAPAAEIDRYGSVLKLAHLF